jgi:hypothetical protein
VESSGLPAVSKRLDFDTSASTSEPVVACLTQDRAGFNQLEAVDLGLVRPNVRNTTPPMPNFGGKRNIVLYPTPASLAELHTGWQSIDMVLISDLAPDQLSERQWAALRCWVMAGGVLIVGSGSAAELQSTAWGDLLPSDITGTGTFGTQDLAVRYGSLLSVQELMGAVQKPKQRSTVLVRSAAQPLVTVGSYGYGAVMLTGFSLSDPVVRQWAGLGPLLRETLRFADRGSPLIQSIVEPAPIPTEPSGPLAKALIDRHAATLPNAGVIALFLAVYVLAVVPVNFWVLGRLGRRELAWITTPALVVAFTAASYSMGRALRGGSLTLRNVTIAETEANRTDCITVSTATLFSPKRARCTFRIGSPHQTVRTGGTTGAPLSITDNAEPERIETTRSEVRITDRLVPQWDMITLRSEGHIPLSGPLNCSMQLLADGYRFRLSNWTGHDLIDCAVTDGQLFQKLGRLAKGETKDVTFSKASARPSRWAELKTNAGENDIASALLQQLDAMPRTEAAIRFVGFSVDELVPLDIEENQPAKHTAAMLSVLLVPKSELSVAGPAAPPSPLRNRISAPRYPKGRN